MLKLVFLQHQELVFLNLLQVTLHLILQVMAAPTFGKAVYIRNLDDTNFIEVHSVATVDTDVIGILEPGEWMFFVLRDTQAVGASADTAACTIEYFAVEIDSAA